MIWKLFACFLRNLSKVQHPLPFSMWTTTCIHTSWLAKYYLVRLFSKHSKMSPNPNIFIVWFATHCLKLMFKRNFWKMEKIFYGLLTFEIPFHEITLTSCAVKNITVIQPCSWPYNGILSLNVCCICVFWGFRGFPTSEKKNQKFRFQGLLPTDVPVVLSLCLGQSDEKWRRSLTKRDQESP